MNARATVLVPLLLLFFALHAHPAGAAEAPDGEAAQHIVEDGETLSSIAAQYFGNPHLWPALYRANRDQIKNPAQLYPGQSLLVPVVSSTRSEAETAPRRGDRAREHALP